MSAHQYQLSKAHQNSFKIMKMISRMLETLKIVEIVDMTNSQTIAQFIKVSVVLFVDFIFFLQLFIFNTIHKN